MQYNFMHKVKRTTFSSYIETVVIVMILCHSYLFELSSRVDTNIAHVTGKRLCQLLFQFLAATAADAAWLRVGRRWRMQLLGTVLGTGLDSAASSVVVA